MNKIKQGVNEEVDTTVKELKQQIFEVLNKGSMVTEVETSLPMYDRFDVSVMALSIHTRAKPKTHFWETIPDDIFEKMYRWINEQEFWNLQLLAWDISLSDNSVDNWRSEYQAEDFDEMVVNLASACCTVYKKNREYQQLNKDGK